MFGMLTSMLQVQNSERLQKDRKVTHDAFCMSVLGPVSNLIFMTCQSHCEIVKMALLIPCQSHRPRVPA